MQYLVYLLISTFGFSVAEFAKRALLAVGFGVVTYFGAYALVDQITDFFNLQISGLPADILSLMGLMQIDVAFTMIASAITSKLALQGWSKLLDNKRERIWKSPGSSDPTTLGA